MSKIKNMFPTFAAIFVCFYLFPLMISDLGSAVFVLLMLNPLVCLICGIYCGRRNKLHIIYTIFVVVSFWPTIFIFHNTSASIYLIVYGAISLIAGFIGKLFKKK